MAIVKDPKTVDKFIAWAREPSALDDLCDFIADGGALSDYCKKHALKWRLLHEWIKDPEYEERDQKVELAIKARDTYHTEETLAKIREAGQVDISAAFQEDGRLKPLKKIPADVRGLISSIDVSTKEDGSEVVKMRFMDRSSALNMMGRHRKMFVDRVEANGTLTLEQAVMASMKAGG